MVVLFLSGSPSVTLHGGGPGCVAGVSKRGSGPGVASWRRELYGPDVGPGRACWPGVLILPRSVGNHLWRWRADPSDRPLHA
jgi:hypothetical protein